jgi:hypothetical protein
MTLTLNPIRKEHIESMWPVMEPHIADALGQAEVTEYGVESVKRFLELGHWLAIGFFDDEGVMQGALTISFISYPNERVAFVTAIGGRLLTNEENWDQLKNICRAHGAGKLQAYSRESVARLWKRLGFENRAILVEAKL